MKTGLRVGNRSLAGILLALAVVVALAAGPVQPAAAATQIDIAGPAGSGAFGSSVTVLPNGNIVVTDPRHDAGTTEDVGAVYLYDGATGALISALTGSTAGDQVGSGMYGLGAVTALSNGNYVVCSPNWDNGAVVDAGAVTWASGTTGVSGVVSAANSLVGSTADDRIGSYEVEALSNGNYTVSSPNWHNGAVVDAGAVTWGDGTTGISGPVSPANSLVGSTASDQVGYDGVEVLSNGNYVVRSRYWDNGAEADAGAVTWGSGTTGVRGVVSAANSLVGSTAGDQVGSGWVMVLPNGNYVVRSPSWDNGTEADAGAVTWGDGTAGISGVVSAANSLVGSTTNDRVSAVTVLDNGNYLVWSPNWDNGGVVDAGAVTWGSGTTGVKGVVSAANSLVGSTDGDQVGYDGVTALTNGNYVVRSRYWDNGGVPDAGAVTWGSGTTGVSGVVSAANSLVGSTAGDEAGSGRVTVLPNGNYVVCSPWWDNGPVADAGAVTWRDGTTGVSGVVSAANSLVGSAGDRVGSVGVTALTNGSYVVASPRWYSGTIQLAGAVTWGDGTTGVSGVVSAANSLVGSTYMDQVGYGGVNGGVTALSNGNYVVASPHWDNGPIIDAGAVTWGNGTTGTVGPVSDANSLVGGTAGDAVGSAWEYGSGVTALTNGNYVVASYGWDKGAVVDAGAATWGDGTTGIAGLVSATNSLVGATAGDRVGHVSDYEPGVTALSNGHYVVGSPCWDNGGVVDAGAATWGDGTTGVVGEVSASNSLVGSTEDDHIGVVYESMWALSNGHYVLRNPYWDNGPVVDAGAMTWGHGTDGTTGPITAENSVLGTAENGGESMRWAYDRVNHQLVVGRPADNIVTLFRLPPVHTVFLPVVLKNAP